MSGVRSLGGLSLPPALGRVGGRPAPQTTGKDRVHDSRGSARFLCGWPAARNTHLVSWAD